MFKATDAQGTLPKTLVNDHILTWLEVLNAQKIHGTVDNYFLQHSLEPRSLANQYWILPTNSRNNFYSFYRHNSS